MLVMPAGAAGWFFHCLARETGRIGHLYSPRNHRGPWPWLPYALDNGAFGCWNPVDNSFDDAKWAQTEQAWRELLCWATAAPIRPMWAIVPDRPGSGLETIERWGRYAPEVAACNIPLALAVQDGMDPASVRDLRPAPEVICVGGTTDWKWQTVEMWALCFKRVHLLRCNAPDKLAYLAKLGVESTDGTGWNRGDRKQTQGLETWARGLLCKHPYPLTPHVCRAAKDRKQLTFA